MGVDEDKIILSDNNRIFHWKMPKEKVTQENTIILLRKLEKFAIDKNIFIFYCIDYINEEIAARLKKGKYGPPLEF